MNEPQAQFSLREKISEDDPFFTLFWVDREIPFARFVEIQDRNQLFAEWHDWVDEVVAEQYPSLIRQRGRIADILWHQKGRRAIVDAKAASGIAKKERRSQQIRQWAEAHAKDEEAATDILKEHQIPYAEFLEIPKDRIFGVWLCWVDGILAERHPEWPQAKVTAIGRGVWAKRRFREKILAKRDVFLKNRERAHRLPLPIAPEPPPTQETRRYVKSAAITL